VGPATGLNATQKRKKFLLLLGEIEPRFLDRSVRSTEGAISLKNRINPPKSEIHLNNILTLRSYCTVLRRIFGPGRDKMQEAEENYKMRSFVTFTLHQA
jgi:hypothetical protein